MFKKNTTNLNNFEIWYFLGKELPSIINKNKTIKGDLLSREIINILSSKKTLDECIYSKKEIFSVLRNSIGISTLEESHRKMIITILTELKYREAENFSEENANIIRFKSTVAEYFKLLWEELDNKTRKKEIVRKRQIIMFLCYAADIGSLEEIGKEIGWKDHATVLHSKNVINKILEEKENKENKQISIDIKNIINMLTKRGLFHIGEIDDEKTKKNLENLFIIFS